MASAHPFNLTTPSDREITVTRTFDAPRQLVFDAFTTPEMLKQWLTGPDGWRLDVCEIDLRVGGRHRYVWRGPEQGECAMGGSFRAVSPPERLVYTELFDEDWTGGETVVTVVFEDHGDKTRVITTVRYSSEAARDGALATPMADGWSQSFQQLDAVLAKLREGTV